MKFLIFFKSFVIFYCKRKKEKGKKKEIIYLFFIAAIRKGFRN
jgi:hypothetical protein